MMTKPGCDGERVEEKVTGEYKVKRLRGKGIGSSSGGG